MSDGEYETIFDPYHRLECLEDNRSWLLFQEFTKRRDNDIIAPHAFEMDNDLVSLIDRLELSPDQKSNLKMVFYNKVIVTVPILKFCIERNIIPKPFDQVSMFEKVLSVHENKVTR